jgi:CheY-like chemotaxis protein
MRYRIALCGFSEFEYRAMHFSFQHPPEFQESSYDVVDALSEADFAVVDADSQPAVKGVVQSGRVAQAVFVGATAPDGAASHLQRPIDPRRILRTLERLTTRYPAGSPGFKLPVPEVHELPTLDDIVAMPNASTEGTSEPASPTALRRAAKAAARAAARRARLASARADAALLEPLRDVLVLDPDPATNAALCTLLLRFGFQPHAVGSIAQAIRPLATRPFAAIFLDMPLDDAGVGLLQRIRELPPPPGHPGPAVLMVAAQLDPAARVLAALAGLGAPLSKPLGRGDVARALESAGVPFPADARRL